ncbi:MAG: FemAB family XrtA/PEP-CTERM system-associated protein [Gammaproteobacteria bacterium]
MKVRHLEQSDVTAWNDFVTGHENGTFFHRAEWKQVFESALGHQGHYLIAESEGTIRGVLPLVHIRSLLFSNQLASVPFQAYGGVLAADDDAARALEAQAIKSGEELGVDFIEFRNREPVGNDWLTKSEYVTFRQEIPATPDECLLSIPRKQRAMVRKGIKHELVSREEGNLDNFYAVFSESYRNLGTPVLARKYFEAIRDAFGADCRVLTVFKDDAPVASVMSYYFNDEVIPYYGGSLASARSLMANDFMYWELMRRSCEAGIRIFDYGRSREGTGSYRFKKHWGFTPQPLYFQYRLIRQESMPDMSPGNPKYRMAIAIWKKLPTSLTRVVGPIIARGLPG